jgi:hypothetical protein
LTPRFDIELRESAVLGKGFARTAYFTAIVVNVSAFVDDV